MQNNFVLKHFCFKTDLLYYLTFQGGVMNYNEKTYGRNDEIAILYQLFEQGRDVSMHGPRRLGKTFLLDRLVDEAPVHKWTAIKVELAGCTESRAVFRELCKEIGKARSGGAQAMAWISQRLNQFTEPRTESGGAWYQPFIGLDHETYFERLIEAMHDDTERRWVLLIDELPIFLKALHDKGDTGIAAARDFMNKVIQLRQKYPRVCWMITGSIGIEPLAKAGNYMGVLAKFQNFELKPLKEDQAKDYIKDLAKNGYLLNRQEITEAEAKELIQAVGWLAPFYIDALAQNLTSPLATEPMQANLAVTTAIEQLIKQSGAATFGTWEEHLRKHYNDVDRAVAFSTLGALARDAQGTDIDGLLALIGQVGLTSDSLRQILMRLETEGFITVDNWQLDTPRCGFLNPLLRLWWLRTRPQFNL
jgi:hypothetical protein